MNLSVHVDNKGKGILIPGEGPTQRLDDIKLTLEAKYSINFAQSGKDLHYIYAIMEATVLYLFMLQMYSNSKQKTKK